MKTNFLDFKYFVLWLFYINFVFSFFLVLNNFGLFLIPFIYDKSYISIVIFLLWLFFDFKIGKELLYLGFLAKKARKNIQVFDDSIEQKLDKKLEFNWIALNIMVFMGLIGTIIGIIITFYPFIANVSLISADKIKDILPVIFSGLGVAFFPSLVSAIFSVNLIITDRILQNNISYVLNMKEIMTNEKK